MLEYLGKVFILMKCKLQRESLTARNLSDNFFFLYIYGEIFSVNIISSYKGEVSLGLITNMNTHLFN